MKLFIFSGIRGVGVNYLRHLFLRFYTKNVGTYRIKKCFEDFLFCTFKQQTILCGDYYYSYLFIKYENETRELSSTYLFNSTGKHFKYSMKIVRFSTPFNNSTIK